MADTRRDDPNASSIAEMRAFPVAAQTARENLPAIPDPGHGEDGGEAHDIARASSLQTKGPSDCDGGAKNWNALANVVVPQDPEREEDQDGAPPTPITGQGPPSFAQSEFYTVNFDSNSQPLLLSSLNSPLHVDCPSSTP
jgi:hypothetical protein